MTRRSQHFTTASTTNYIRRPIALISRGFYDSQMPSGPDLLVANDGLLFPSRRGLQPFVTINKGRSSFNSMEIVRTASQRSMLHCASSRPELGEGEPGTLRHGQRRCSNLLRQILLLSAEGAQQRCDQDDMTMRSRLRLSHSCSRSRRVNGRFPR